MVGKIFNTTTISATLCPAHMVPFLWDPTCRTSSMITSQPWGGATTRLSRTDCTFWTRASKLACSSGVGVISWCRFSNIAFILLSSTGSVTLGKTGSHRTGSKGRWGTNWGWWWYLGGGGWWGCGGARMPQPPPPPIWWPPIIGGRWRYMGGRMGLILIWRGEMKGNNRPKMSLKFFDIQPSIGSKMITGLKKGPWAQNIEAFENEMHFRWKKKSIRFDFFLSKIR